MEALASFFVAEGSRKRWEMHVRGRSRTPPLRKCVHFKDETVRRRYRSEQTLSYVCEAYNAEHRIEILGRGPFPTKNRNAERESVEKCTFVWKLSYRMCRSRVNSQFFNQFNEVRIRFCAHKIAYYSFGRILVCAIA